MVKPVMLAILDGWGNAPVSDDNAVALANTPVWDELQNSAKISEIHTSGLAVGLPDRQMGNSEVGHMNIGAGRVVYQSLTRIEKAANEHGFHDNAVLVGACQAGKGKTIHVLGLLSPGGVHSHEDHIETFIKLAKEKGVAHIYLHAFMDGRDMPPKSAKPSLERFMALEDSQFKIASICGRYFAMDRDKNWQRVEQSYRVIADATAPYQAKTAIEALELAYARGENDEFVSATVIENAHAPQMIDGDILVSLNFRADRARQLIRTFYDADFNEFSHRQIKLAKLVTMTAYQADMLTEVAFPPETVHNGLGEVVANHHLSQLRIAETEKYAHVTYFFNGGEEKVFNGEDRILIQSPNVATYDLQPEMNAFELTEKLTEAIRSQQYDFICVNFANPDMVGHSGVLSAAIKAVETVDTCLGEILKATKEVGMDVLVTADHGNVEQMINPKTGGPMTSHTTNVVPLVYVGQHDGTLNSGALCDLAPTVLALMGLDVPAEMTGKVLIN